MTHGEKETYEAMLTKFGNICEENELIYKINNRVYPFAVIVTPDKSSPAQLTLIEDDTGRTGKDAKLILSFPDGVLQYQFSDDFALSEALMNKLKINVSKLYAQWCKICYRDGIQANRFAGGPVEDVGDQDGAPSPDPETEPEYAEL